MSKLDEIIGYKKQVKKLRTVCDFLKDTSKYVYFGVDLPEGLLIYGESGVGKTFMAKALAIDCGREIFNISRGDLNVKSIKKIFASARKNKNALVFIDDIDYLDKEDDASVYGYIAHEIENCNGSEVFVLVTADDKENLHEFFLNTFNSDMVIELEAPEIEEAVEIFKPIFVEDKMDKDFNIEDFCYFAQNWTYSEVEDVFNKSACLAVYEGREKISMRHVIKSGMLYKNLVLSEEFDEATAYHEAGHAAVHMLTGGEAAFIAMLADDEGMFKVKMQKLFKDYRDRERRYFVGIAGKVSEEMFSGITSIGSDNDLDKVSRFMEDDIRELASQGFEYYDSTKKESPAYNDELARKVRSDMQSYYDKTKELIEKNKPLIEALVKKLKEKYYLLHSEIYKIYNAYKG